MNKQNRDRLPWALVLVLLVSLVGAQWYYSNPGAGAGEAVQRAQTLEAAVPVIAAQRDLYRSQRDSIAAVYDIQRVAYTADSIKWEGERAGERRERAHYQRTYTNLADSIKSRVDEETASMVGVLQMVHRDVVRSLENEITILVDERASLWAQRETMGELYAAAIATSDLNKDLAIMWEEAANQWEGAYRGEVRRRRLITAGIGTVVGVAIAVKVLTK